MRNTSRCKRACQQPTARSYIQCTGSGRITLLIRSVGKYWWRYQQIFCSFSISVGVAWNTWELMPLYTLKPQFLGMTINDNIVSCSFHFKYKKLVTIFFGITLNYWLVIILKTFIWAFHWYEVQHKHGCNCWEFRYSESSLIATMELSESPNYSKSSKGWFFYFYEFCLLLVLRLQLFCSRKTKSFPRTLKEFKPSS